MRKSITSLKKIGRSLQTLRIVTCILFFTNFNTILGLTAFEINEVGIKNENRSRIKKAHRFYAGFEFSPFCGAGFRHSYHRFTTLLNPNGNTNGVQTGFNFTQNWQAEISYQKDWVNNANNPGNDMAIANGNPMNKDTWLSPDPYIIHKLDRKLISVYRKIYQNKKNNIHLSTGVSAGWSNFRSGDIYVHGLPETYTVIWGFTLKDYAKRIDIKNIESRAFVMGAQMRIFVKLFNRLGLNVSPSLLYSKFQCKNIIYAYTQYATHSHHENLFNWNLGICTMNLKFQLNYLFF